MGDAFVLPRGWLFQQQKEQSTALLLSGAKNCHQGEETEILSTERRTRRLAAISRADLTEKILEIDRVGGIHFQSGKAAYLWNRFNPDWVPSLHLGHDKLKESDETKEKQQERAQRITERRKREREREEQKLCNGKL